MDEFKARQLAQIHFVIADFREGEASLNMLLSRLEGAARAFGQELWERNVFDTALALEQINADVVEERRTLTPPEQMQVEFLIAQLETRLSQIESSTEAHEDGLHSEKRHP